MKKGIALTVFISLFVFIYSASGMTDYGMEIIDRVKLKDTDIPGGFMFGKIPAFAQRVLKDNPWKLDESAIKKLTRNIYPDGDYQKVSGIHMTILANKKNPHGDDIVCYIFLYRNSQSAKTEISKIRDYVKYNSDRSLLVIKDNLVIYYHVDDVENYRYIKNMADSSRKIISSL